jgi:hypothetical protein
MRDAYSACKIWIKKSEDENDCYDKFVYLWFAFNAIYNNYFDSYNDSERYAIKKMIDGHRHLLKERASIEILGDSATIYFMNRTIRDCKINGNDTSEHRIILSQQDQSHARRIKSLCMILYQVRCNLFHGNKLFGRESDDEVVKQASIALGKVIKALCP